MLELQKSLSDTQSQPDIARLGLENRAASVTKSAFTTATQSQRAAEDLQLDILLGADKHGQVFGLEIPKIRKHSSASPPIFELRLPQSVTKFARGAIRAPWHKLITQVKGVITDDVFGSTTDGTIYHFTILTNDARCLLKFLENLVKWNERQDRIASFLIEREFTKAGRKQESAMDIDDDGDALSWCEPDIVIDPEYVPGEVDTRQRRAQYGINGDFLLPLLEGTQHARVTRLIDMLQRGGIITQEDEDRARSSRHAGNDPGERTRKCQELIKRALPDVDENAPYYAYKSCLRWMDELMRPVL